MHLTYLYTAVSWVLLRWHQLFTAVGLSEDSGLNWALSIVFLVVTARLLLFRVFIRQIKYQREMQVIQPKIQALREKYKSDRAEMQRQMMALQQEHGFNPLAGCLPILLQIPIFIGLFHVLRHLANSVNYKTGDQRLAIYSFTPKETLSAAHARLFGAPLAGRLTDTATKLHTLSAHVDAGTTRLVIIVLVILSACATFGTQLLVRRAATTTPEGTAATVQRLMMYFIPLSTLFSGVIFPLGVLVYWFTSNTWTLGQQVYVNRFHPQTAPVKVETGTLGKTLAPKPGARPDRNRTPLVKDVPEINPVNDVEAPPAAAPRPGQKPVRPGGNRPPAKRPNQKKRR